MKPFLLLALFPVLALAQGVQRGPRAGVQPAEGGISAGPSTAVLWVPFSSPGCFASGSAMGTRGETVTFTRAGSATYLDSAGALKSCPSNQLRVGPNGALIEGVTTNLLLYSEQIDNAAWGSAGSPTVTPNGALDPAGYFSMDLVTSPTVSDYRYQNVTVTSSAGPFTSSAWVRSNGTSSSGLIGQVCAGANVYTCTCTRSDGGTCNAAFSGSTCTVDGVFGTSPVRLMATSTCTAAVTTVGAYLAGGTASTGGAAYFTMAQFETGPSATGYVATTATAATRAADQASVTAPATATQRVWTVNGMRSSAPVTGGATVTLPTGTVRNVLMCKRPGGTCQ